MLRRRTSLRLSTLLGAAAVAAALTGVTAANAATPSASAAPQLSYQAPASHSPDGTLVVQQVTTGAPAPQADVAVESARHMRRHHGHHMRRHHGSPKAIARSMMHRHGWGHGEFACLDRLWMRESGWRVHALNKSSGAYGIPQALPATKMASAGPDWRDNAATQITWGLRYIKSRYGSPCRAWAHEVSAGWY